MPATYEAIATTTLSSAQADITFQNIPGTFTDIILVLVGTTDTANGRTIYAQFNGDTASNYSATLLAGDGTNVSSSRASNNTYMFLTVIPASGTTTGMAYIHINNYANASRNKILLSRGDNTANNAVRLYANLWRSTAAITSIKLYPNADNFGIGTRATLYGIKAA